MTPTSNWTRLLGLFFLSLLTTGFHIQTSAIRSVDSFDNPIAFVDKTSVDLKWDDEGIPTPFDIYNIYRGTNPIPIASLSTSVTFFRDSGLSEGQSYSYRIEAYDSVNEIVRDSSGPHTVTAGHLGGTLYADKTWPAGTYNLYGSVNVATGALFTIQPWAAVDGAGDYSISDISGGILNINGVSMMADVIISHSGSVLDLTDFSASSILYYERSDTFNSDNYFTDGSDLIVGYHTGAWPTIQGQTFDSNSRLLVINNGLATVTGCTFNESRIEVTDGGSASISSNEFIHNPSAAYPYGVYVASNAGPVDILNNDFDGASIRVGSTTSLIDIRGNIITGGGTGIHVVGGSPAIENNLLFSLSTGIHYSDDGIHTAGGSASGNTIAINTTGIDVDNEAAPTIQNNCIAGNSRGAYVDTNRSGILNMTSNWWGSPTGPYYETGNMDGLGNEVYDNYHVNVVDISGWLTSDNCAVSDYEIYKAEAVQVVQSLEDPVDLVAGRETILRVYAHKAIGTIGGIEGLLSGYKDGEYFGDLTSENTISIEPFGDFNDISGVPDDEISIALEAQLDGMRSDLQGGGVYFELPDAWTTPGVLTYTVQLNPDMSPEELKWTNNEYNGSVTFRDLAPFRIAYVPILYSPGDGDPVPPSAGKILKGHVFLQSVFPYAEVEMGLLPPITWKKQMRGTIEQVEAERGDELLSILNVTLIYWNMTHPPEQRFNQIIGVFPGDALEMISFASSDPRWGGEDLPSGGLGQASYCWASGDCFAHEIGHNLGLHHTNVTGKDCYAPDSYMTYWNNVYTDNTIQDPGYHDVRNEIVPSTKGDIMSFCTNNWISPLHWEMLMDVNSVPQPPYEGETPITLPNRAVEEDATYLIVRGWSAIDGVSDFLPFWTAQSNNLPLWTPDNGSDYCVRMKDVGGSLIDEKCMDLHHYNMETYNWTATESFIAAFPLPAGRGPEAIDEIAEISLYVDDYSQDMTFRQPSAHVPGVTVTAPTAGAVLSADTLITWNGSDADNDPLVYSVFYRPSSTDPWNPLIADTPETSLSVSLQDLPAGTAGQFKVEASDGFHVGQALSGLVTVPERTPSVYILSPVAEENYEPSMQLSGYGYHPDTGMLPAESLSWSSNLDGSLGTGSTITVTLSEGSHLITLTGTSGDQTATSTVSIDVNANAVIIGGLQIIGPSSAAVGTPVTFEASLTQGTDVTYTWDFNDGTTATGKIVTHVFPLYENSYFVTLRAENSVSQREAYKEITISADAQPEQPYQLYLPVTVRSQ